MYTAMILEPRQHPAMEFVLRNFLDNLDERWNILVWHGTENGEWMKAIVNASGNAERVELRNLGVVNLLPHEYSRLMVSPSFIRSIPTEIFLIFQTDSMISSKYKDFIYEFIQYDYTGAPWPNGAVGNGGLSLRRRSKMLEIAEKGSYSPPCGEDMFFSETSVTTSKPSFEQAKRFSIETVYSEAAFGVHKAWIWTDKVTEEQCPGYQELRRLNKGYHD
jgi:hypothetical protein